MVADSAHSALVQMLTGGGSSAGSASLEDLAAQIGQRDPRLALLASYLVRRQEQPLGATPSDPEDPDADADAPFSADHARAERRVDARRRLQERFASMSAELMALRERSEALAQALGACEHCWGFDPTCRGCRGIGGPGAFLPDPQLFDELVLPALRRVRRQQTRAPTGQPVDIGAPPQRRNATAQQEGLNERERI